MEEQVINQTLETPATLETAMSAPAQEIQTPAPQPPSLEDLTGGRFKSREEIDSHWGEYERLKGNPRMANDFVKNLNAGFESGNFKDFNDALRFMQLQTLPVETMTPAEALKWNRHIETGDPMDRVNDWFSVMYPEIPEDDLDFQLKSKQREFAIEDAARVARQAILSKKVDPATLKSVQPEQSAAPAIDHKAQYAQAQAMVSPVIASKMSEFREHDIVINNEDGTPRYALKVPVAITPEQARAIQEEVTFDAIASGIDVGSVQGTAAVQRMIADKVRTAEFSRILEAMERDINASLTEKFMKENSNSRPVQNGSSRHQFVAPDKNQGPKVFRGEQFV